MIRLEVLPYLNNWVTAEIRLLESIDCKLRLFQYFGVTDTEDLNTLKWSAGRYDKSCEYIKESLDICILMKQWTLCITL